MRKSLYLLFLPLLLTGQLHAADLSWTPSSELREKILAYVAENYIYPYDRTVRDEYVWKHLIRNLYSHSAARADIPQNPTVCPKLDPYTYLAPPESVSQELVRTTGQFVGVGIEMSPHESGGVAVEAVGPDGPAEKAGVLEGDVLKEYVQDDGTRIPLDITNAIELLRGTLPGSKARVVVSRGGQERIVSISRDVVPVASLRFEVLNRDEYGIRLDAPVGYVHIFNYTLRTADEFEAALSSMQKQYGKDIPVIVDLWGNPGGTTVSAYEFLYLLSDDVTAPTITVRGRDSSRTLSQQMPIEECFSGSMPMMKFSDGSLCVPFTDPTTGYTKMPGRFGKTRMVFMVHRYSVSAAELVPAALKSLRRADPSRIQIIGTEPTYGKGVGQRVGPLGNGPESGSLHVTVFEFLGGNGTKINEVGVTPDEIVSVDQTDTPPSERISPHRLVRQRGIEILSGRS